MTVTVGSTQLLPPQLHLHHQPPIPRHSSASSCHLHPDLPPFTGFCSSCLRDRLSRLPAHLPRSKSLSASLLQPRRGPWELPGEEHRAEQEAGVPPASDDPDPRRKKPAGGIWLAASALTRRLRGGWRRKPKSCDLSDARDAGPSPPPPGKREKLESRRHCDAAGGTHVAGARSLPAAACKNPPSKTWEARSEAGGCAARGRRSCDVDPRFSLDDVAGPRFSWDWADAEPCAPGGAAQTREYYSERRRRSVDHRPGSARRSLVVDLDDARVSNDNTKLTPALVGELFGRKLDKEPPPVHADSPFRNVGRFDSSHPAPCSPKPPSRRWGGAWRILGSMQRGGSWRNGRRGETGMFRSNSNASSRHSVDGSFGDWSIGPGKLEILGGGGGGGLLRFYLTPTHGDLERPRGFRQMG